MASVKNNDDTNEEKMPETAYNTVFYKHFMKYCEDIHQSLAKTKIKKSAVFKTIDKKEVINCGLLSKGVYNYNKYSPLLKKTPNLTLHFASRSTKNETTEWGFLTNSSTKTGYIVFRGTSGETIGIDVLTDISIVPTPIWCEDDQIIKETKNNDDEDTKEDNDWKDLRKGHNHRWDFAVHSGIYSSVLRIFGVVLRELRKQKDKFNTLYITGHSLGGGLAILFGLELLLRRMIPQNITTHIVTFGAPYVLSLEYKITTLREKAKWILTTLHSMTHCFVNKFDIVSRIPSPWILEILFPTIPGIIAGVIKESSWRSWASISSILIGKFGGSTIDSLKNQFMKHQPMLSTYKPFGTYYILLNDRENNCYIIDDSADNGTTKQILSFIPPIRKDTGIVKSTEKILAHYYYKKILQVNSDQLHKLMRQRSVKFSSDDVWRVEHDSKWYGELEKCLFGQQDLYKLIQNHFMDNYLNGLVERDFKDKIVLTQLACLKLFSIGIETQTGDSIWQNVDKNKYLWKGEKCGSLRLQSRIYSQFLANFNPTALHTDKYRLTMKSKTFTDDKIMDVCHSNDEKIVKKEFERIKQLMMWWETEH